MKKIFSLVLLGILSVGFVSCVFSGPVFAADSEPCNKTLLFFRTWYYNLDDIVEGVSFMHETKKDGKGNTITVCNGITVSKMAEDEFAMFVWGIILNIAFDLFAAVGIIATGYIIFAGYQYITAGGDTGKVANARKSLVTSLAGVLVSLSASVLVNTITDVIKPITDITKTNETVLAGFNLAYAIAGVVATGFIIYGGFQYTLSAGDSTKTKKGRTTLIYSAVGLVIVLAAAGITNFIIGALG